MEHKLVDNESGKEPDRVSFDQIDDSIWDFIFHNSKHTTSASSDDLLRDEGIETEPNFDATPPGEIGKEAWLFAKL